MQRVSTAGARRRSFEQLAFPQMNGLYNLALSMTRNRADAEDLTQETFLRAYTHFDRFRQGTNFRAWLFRILRNLTINQVKRRRVRGVRVELDPVFPQLSADRTDPFAPRAAGFAREDLEDALGRLSAEHRTAVLLCYVGGFSYAEIAEAMGTPVGTVMSRIYRARRRLRRDLDRAGLPRGDAAPLHATVCPAAS